MPKMVRLRPVRGMLVTMDGDIEGGTKTVVAAQPTAAVNRAAERDFILLLCRYLVTAVMEDEERAEEE